jgi:SAM-dependent methyltransferase
MDRRSLLFDDGSFDVVFSFFSVEHFGGPYAATRAMRKMGRVVRPGGVVVTATELILNGLPHPEYFLPDEIVRSVIEPSGLQLVEDIDFSLSPERLIFGAIDLDSPGWESFSPRYVFKRAKWLWTSVLFFGQKP